MFNSEFPIFWAHTQVSSPKYNFWPPCLTPLWRHFLPISWFLPECCGHGIGPPKWCRQCFLCGSLYSLTPRGWDALFSHKGDGTPRAKSLSGSQLQTTMALLPFYLKARDVPRPFKHVRSLGMPPRPVGLGGIPRSLTRLAYEQNP